MKYITILLVVFILVGCNPEADSGSQATTTDGDFKIRVIDGCQYIEYDYGIFDQRVYSLTHKGNCNNPIHIYNNK